MKRLLTTLITVFVCMNASATILFGTDVETALSRDTANDINGVWWQGTTTGLCEKNTNDGPTNTTRRSTDFALSGSYSLRFGLFWNCDYVFYNGGTLVKPRSAISFNNTNAKLSTGTEYWTSHNFYFPTEWIFDPTANPDNLFQYHKLDNTGSLGKNFFSIDMVGSSLTFSLAHSDGATQSPISNSYTPTRGVWHKSIMHVRPCTATSGGSCGTNGSAGFMRLYVKGTGSDSYTKTITNITQANPAVVTSSAAHGLTTGDYVIIGSVAGMTEVNDAEYQITVVDADEFSLDGVNSTGYTAYTSGGEAVEAFLIDSGANTVATGADFTMNFYKYAWHCTQSGPGYPGSGDARADRDWCMNIQSGYPVARNPTNDNGTTNAERVFYADDWFVGDSSSSPLEVSPYFFGDDTPGPTGGGVTNMANQPLTAGYTPQFWTSDYQNGVNALGLYQVTLTDAYSNSSNAAIVYSNSNGGRLQWNSGDFDSMIAGAATATFYYDNSMQYDSENPADPAYQLVDWALFNSTLTAYTPGDNFGNTEAVVMENTGASAGRVTMKTTFDFAQVSGQNVNAVFTFLDDSDYSIRIAVLCNADADQIIWTGTLGSSLTQDSSGTGTAHSVTQGVSDSGFVQYRLQYTANASNDCRTQYGLNEGGAGKQLTALNHLVWVNRTEATLTYSTTVNAPDVTAPILTGCDLVELSPGNLQGTCSTSEIGGTYYAIIDTLDTCPNATQIKAGQDSGGSAAVYATSGEVTSTTISFTAGYSTLIDAYMCMYHEDVATNGSAVESAENGVPAATETSKEIIVTGGRTSSGALASRTYDSCSLYTDQTEGTAIATFGSVTMSSGAFTLDEADTTSGSVDALTAGQSYWLSCEYFPTATITAATQADPVVLTLSSNCVQNDADGGSYGYITGVAGMTEINSKAYFLNYLTSTTASLALAGDLSDVDGTGYTAYTSGGSLYCDPILAKTYVTVTEVAP